MKYVCCILASWLVLTPFATAEVITAAQGTWPPFINGNAKQPGIAVEIVTAAYRNQGYELQFETLPWLRALKSVQKNRIDIIPAIWFTEKRAKQFSYSHSFLDNEVVFIKRHNDPYEYSGLESLTGKKVGIIKGYGYDNTFLTATNFEKIDGYSLLVNLKQLRSNRIDLALADKIVAKYTMQKSELSLTNFAFSSTPLSTYPLHIAIGQTNPNAKRYLDIFNKGLDEIKRNGQLEKIVKKYGIH